MTSHSIIPEHTTADPHLSSNFNPADRKPKYLERGMEIQYPFGMVMTDRQWSQYVGDRYRFGFQGQEGDDGWKGDGNSYEFKYRIHDPRIGRFLSVDPLAKDYSYNSPYAFAENRVIDGIEWEGLEYVHYLVELDVDGTFLKRTLIQDFQNMGNEQLMEIHGKSAAEFYQEESQSYGEKGPGVQYTYVMKNARDDSWMEMGTLFTPTPNFGYGFYAGTGCPTIGGPWCDINTNPYDFSHKPIDLVDKLAQDHDRAYNFDGYGRGDFFTLLPAWYTDYRTLAADRVFVAGLKQFLEDAKDKDYEDPITHRRPTAASIEYAEKAIKLFEDGTWYSKVLGVKAVIPYKEGKKQEAEAETTETD